MPRSTKRKLPAGLWLRGNVYFARFRSHGLLVRQRLSSDFTAAVRKLNDLKARADLADFSLVDNNCPWPTLKEAFLKWVRQSLRRPEDYERDLKRFEEYRPIASVQQVDAALVVGYRDWRAAQGNVSARTVNREVGTVRNMLNKGVAWKFLGHNPIKDLAPLAHDTAIKERRALSVAEVEAIFAASPEYLKPVWRMFMVTGIRKSELVTLKFSNIDFERRVMTVRAGVAKSHKPREIPLDDEMLAMLARLRDQAKDRRPVLTGPAKSRQRQAANFSREHVFVTRVNTPLKNNLLTRFYEVCEKAGIPGAENGGTVDIHSLRVTFCTLALENGANPRDVQAILGHATLAMTMSVYAKATDQSKRAAIGALPFASMTSPAHILPLPGAKKRRAETGTSAHKARTSKKACS
ncbi:MAG: tyrosine-type recombinase/integrase [Pirellulales bacterium]